MHLKSPWCWGREFEQALGVGDGQGGLAYCSPWGHKESDMTERLNWTEQYSTPLYHFSISKSISNCLCCISQNRLYHVALRSHFQNLFDLNEQGLLLIQVICLSWVGRAPWSPGLSRNSRCWAQTMSVVEQGKRTLEGLDLAIKCPGLEVICVTYAHSSNV